MPSILGCRSKDMATGGRIILGITVTLVTALAALFCRAHCLLSKELLHVPHAVLQYLK